MALLRFLADSGLRARVTAATNKAEAYNGFSAWTPVRQPGAVPAMPAAELCDRPVTVEQVWGRPAIAELRDRLATADGPHEMLTLLEEELTRRLCETAGLGLVRHTSSVIAATSGGCRSAI